MKLRFRGESDYEHATERRANHGQNMKHDRKNKKLDNRLGNGKLQGGDLRARTSKRGVVGVFG